MSWVGEIFKYLQKLPPLASIVALFLALMILIVAKWESVSKIFKKISGKAIDKSRTCGDCVLVLFGIREKYEYQARRIDTNLLRMQMTFAEQKIQEVIFFLSQSFNEDIKVYGEGVEYDRKATQSALYCEALKNSMLSVKDEIRRSIKENGFEDMSESEYAHYVKDKTHTMITIIRSYLNQHYVDNDKMIVKLNDRFEKMDKYHIEKFESWAFDVFTNAKNIAIESANKKMKISKDLKNEIDSFIKPRSTPSNC